MLSVAIFHCYAERPYAECRYAVCRGAVQPQYGTKKNVSKWSHAAHKQ